MENNCFDETGFLTEAERERKRRLENDPAYRTDPMEYLPGMEIIKSDIRDKVLSEVDMTDFSRYAADDVRAALSRDSCTVDDLKALLSPAAMPFLEEMAGRASRETGRRFGNTVYMFTPLYISNYCGNYCVYCGFNRYNHIKRIKLTAESMEREMKLIADSGIEEILILTGESRTAADIEYIAGACRLAGKYFRSTGLEIFPANTDEYRRLHECGADYVTVFQETYDIKRYEALHLLGHKRVFPYRFDAQERALRGGMRGVAFSALLGLADFRKDALATALHAYYIQRKYPHAEISLSCPRLRPVRCGGKLVTFAPGAAPEKIGEAELCQILCAYRIFLPFAGITVSSRESASFRDGIMRIAATKVSAGVSTGVGDHEIKYAGKSSRVSGSEQFRISDGRSFEKMYNDISNKGLQPVLNDSLYV